MKTPKGWTKSNNELVAVIKCKDFKHAMALLNTIGDIAEELQHHPNLGIKDYNEVVISTTTHDANTLTEKDYRLADEINAALNYEELTKDIDRTA